MLYLYKDVEEGEQHDDGNVEDRHRDQQGREEAFYLQGRPVLCTHGHLDRRGGSFLLDGCLPLLLCSPRVLPHPLQHCPRQG